MTKITFSNLLFASCFLLAQNTLFAQINATYTLPQGNLKAFLQRSNLGYFEELHGDLLSNTDITMPIFEGCATNCSTPESCQCSQWKASTFITDRLEYPENGYKAGWVGDFRIEYTIDEIGRAKDVEVFNCESAALVQQISAVVPKMPLWKPAKVNNQATALRIYSNFSFSLIAPNESATTSGTTQAFLNWGNTNLGLDPKILNVLSISEAELSVIKNEPILFRIGDDELAIQAGSVVFKILKTNKEYKMDAAETLDSDRTDKVSAFIDAYLEKGSEIQFTNLKAFNPNSGNTINIPDLTVKIQ